MAVTLGWIAVLLLVLAMRPGRFPFAAAGRSLNVPRGRIRQLRSCWGGLVL